MHYRHPKWSAKQIAEVTGFPVPTVQVVFWRNQIKPANAAKRLQDWEKQAIKDAFARGEKSIAVALEFGCDEATVSRIGRRGGLPKRKPGRRPDNAQRAAAMEWIKDISLETVDKLFADATTEAQKEADDAGLPRIGLP